MADAPPPPLPLSGLRVLALGGGAAAAYCGRLLADAGAQVLATAFGRTPRTAGLLRHPGPAEQAYADWLDAGKTILPNPQDAQALLALAGQVDLLLLGEDRGEPAPAPSVAPSAGRSVGPSGQSAAAPPSDGPGGLAARLAQAPRVACVDLQWFGGQGPRSGWRGSDLVIQALTGMPQMAGRVAGPPLSAGDRQATLVAGVTAYIAACAALVGAPDRPAGPEGQGLRGGTTRQLQVSILEANLVLAEMHMHFFQRDGLPMRRCGLNRFAPNSPVGIYPCAQGWVGITVATPDQWRALCAALSLTAQAADEGLATRERRFERLDEVEQVLCQALARHTADEWAAIGRRHRVPIVVVPDAPGILQHPIFRARQSLAALGRADAGQPAGAHAEAGAAALQVPRTPFGLTATPVATQLAPARHLGRTDALDLSAARADAALGRAPAGAAVDAPPLAGITLVDFAMGWAGPLASRLLADLGAEVVKVEAGRYPDWWRGMNWTPEFIAERQYEQATIFCGMNRGKQGISLDLTTPTGRDTALALVARADAVVENQAAGVMAKFGLDEAALRAVRPDLVMASMSAFGTGNAWSDTRAYGSTLEQGSGLPSLTGFAGDAPTMTHLALGDPIGGLYGCAALLTGLVHRRRHGQGQYLNLSMVEAMLQFTTPGLLQHQTLGPSAQAPSGAGEAPLRRGNRRPSLAPHGFYPAAGTDQWLAVAVDSADAFAALARLIGRTDWADDPALRALAARQAIEDQIDAAIADWSGTLPPAEAAARLQAAGVAAAELVHADQLPQDAHLAAVGFFIDLERAVSGPQRQCGVAIRQAGQRLGARRPAPLLGEHTQAVLQRHLGLGQARFQALVDQGVVSLAPKPARNLL